MKFFSTFLIFTLLANHVAESRLVGKRRNQKGRHGKNDRQQDQSPSTAKLPKSSKKSSALIRTEAKIFEIEDVEVHRNTNQVRITLVGVEEIDSMSPTETLFFEDAFMSAFLEVQDNDDEDDVQVRSMIVLSDSSSSSSENNRLLRRRDRSLWRTPGRYFDIAALFEWSCRFCGVSTSTRTNDGVVQDDDHTDDDFYFNGVVKESPTDRPTTSPTANPTDFWFDDDHTDDDFYFNGPSSGDSIPVVQPDTYTDDIFYFMGTANSDPDDSANDGEDWVLGNISLPDDDDLYSFLFGKRHLEQEESDERRFETLLCAKLSAGPFQAFQNVKECFVAFKE